MKDEKKKIMMASIVTLLVLLSIFAIVPASVSAASQSPTVKAGTTVGTVTLSPSNGAFPGQIVYYKWTGVPTDLVPPVYVTVYMNGAAYSTQVASYDSVNGVLTGTFTMPNDQPGTTFDVSFSYTDSAGNYATSTVTGTGTMYVGMSPQSNVTASSVYPQEGSAQFSGTTSLGGWTEGTISSSGSNSMGCSMWDFNVTNQLYPHYTNLYNSTMAPDQSVDINAQAAYVTPANFTQDITSHKTVVNVTTVDKGTAILSLPATDVIPSTFTFNTAGDQITKITTNFYVNSTVSGVLVSFKFTGIYASTITAPGTYTMPGTFVTVSPASLSELTGQFSASYDIHDFGISGNTYYVNYTLSITFSGSWSYVSVNAQYLTSIYVNNTGTSSTFTNTTTVNLQAGYSFESKYVGLENPGITGTYVFSFYNSTLDTWVNGTQFSFSNNTTAEIINGLAPIYFNNTINMIGFNRTVTGAINISLTTNYFIQGVYAIAPAVWDFNMTLNFSLMSDDGRIMVDGYLINNTYWVKTQQLTLQAVVTPTHDFGNWNQEFYPLINATLSTYLGYPKINYFGVGKVMPTFTYEDQQATLTLGATDVVANFVALPSTVGTTNYFYGERAITGLNETLEYGSYVGAADVNVTVTVNAVSPVIYGVTNTGVLNITYNVTTAANNTGMEIVLNESTAPAVNFEFTVGSVPMDYTNILMANYYKLSLYEIAWYLHDAKFMACLYAVFPGYSGMLVFNGTGSNNAVNTLLTVGTSISVPGTVSGLSGFANNSMGGWYNASLYVSSSSYYALYGGVFKGNYYIYANFGDIKKNSTEYPFFEGYLYTDISTAPVEPALPVSEIYALDGTYYYSGMDITDYMQYVNITNANISGMQTITWNAYGISNTYSWYTGNFDIIMTSSTSWYNTFYNVPLTITGTLPLGAGSSGATVDVYYHITVGRPLQNVSLTPIINSFTSVRTLASIGNTTTSVYYNLSSVITNSTSLLLNLQNGGMNSYNMALSGYAQQEIKLQNYQLTFYGNINGVTFVTGSVLVNNVGSYFVMGTANSMYGSGTLTGYVNILQHTPYVSSYGNGYNDFRMVGYFNVHLYAANGTQAYFQVELPVTNNFVYSPSNQYYVWSVPSEFSYTTVKESSNYGMVDYGNYKLEQGSGAMVVTLSNDQIATIVTQLGDVVNISISQLNAKIVGLWNTANETYALLNTAYGQMSAKLSAIDAKITDIKNGMATIQTDLGNVQTSLSNLDAKITKLQGDVATIQTTLGTVQVKLNAINATVVSNAKGISDLKGSVVEIQTTLGTIKGTVTDIKDGVATIQTNLGTVQTDVNNIKTNTANTANSVNTTLYWQIGVLILVIITLALVAYVIVQVNKIAKKKESVEEETTEETEE